MKKYLLAYQISGQTIGVDVKMWSISNLNGNQPFKIILSGQTIPSGYTDISSIINWDTFGCSIATDYLVCKNAIKDIIINVGWSNLNNTEKDIGIKYYAIPNIMDGIIYLMTEKGYTQQNAQSYILYQWHRHHGKLINCCKQRWYYVKLVVPAYLNFNDAEDLLNTVEPLILIYCDMGRLGLNYGDKRDGIMDYIESTNAFGGQGLRENNYDLLVGTWDDFILSLKNIFIEGIYEKYLDI